MAGQLELVTRSPSGTRNIGARLGALAGGGDLFLLTGDLGAGKTCLTQGIALGLGVDELPVSPSFVLIRQYDGRLPLYHIDFYRLERIEEITDLGLDDYLYGYGVCVIEWAERAQGMLPDDHMLVRIEHLDRNSRRLRLEPRGPRYMEILSQLEKTETFRNRKWNLP
ncbi:tRNA (adenosine(37)-N6)-threonylcarbamoyltransferase complex ATPase subunit type 1 TsaE [Chloroflexota bacterium]